MALTSIHQSRFFDDSFDWFYHDPLDFYDPWIDFELRPLPLTPVTSIRWIREPTRVKYSTTTKSTRSRSVSWSTNPPPINDKFRVEFSANGFRPETIRTFVENGKIIVQARQEDRQSSGDYSAREIRKSYELPANADGSQLISYIKPDNILVIEVPIRNEDNVDHGIVHVNTVRRSSVSPFNQAKKRLELSFDLKGFRPDDIKVSVRHNHLVIQADRRNFDGSRSERSSFYKTMTLPSGTYANEVNSYLMDDGTLKVEVPYNY